MLQQSPRVEAAGTEPLVLAVDLGTSGCKCALTSIGGTVAAWAFEPVPLHIDGIAAEQDPRAWWSAFLAAAGALLRQEVVRRRVAAVCCSTAGEATVCVDRNGEALGQAMLYLDMRGRDAIGRRLKSRWFNVEGASPLNLWRWLRTTGGLPAGSGKDCAGHIAFIRDTDPERYDRTYKFLNGLDYMNLRLTGRFTATPDSQATTWITDNRDAEAIRYDDELIDILRFDREKFPELIASTDLVGPLLPAVADILGLGRNTVVIAGAVDTSAVAVGAAVSDFAPHLYLGTSSWVGAHVPAMKTDVFNKIAAIPCAIKGRYLAMALQSTAGANLSFLRDRILYHPDELLSDERRPDVYELLNRIAARVPAGANGLIYMPWLYGERTPVEDPHLRGGFLNLSLHHSREDIIRAVMEGVALNTRWMMEPHDRFLGRKDGAIAAVGGGAQSDTWCQIIADVTGRHILQMENPIQTNAIGASFIAGIGLGELAVGDLPALQRVRRAFEPKTSLKPLYDERFGDFKDLHKRLSPVYRRLNGPDRRPAYVQ